MQSLIFCLTDPSVKKKKKKKKKNQQQEMNAPSVQESKAPSKTVFNVPDFIPFVKEKESPKPQ